MLRRGASAHAQRAPYAADLQQVCQLQDQLWLAETLLLREHDNEAESHLNAALEMAQAHSRVLLLLQGERLHARLLATRNDWPAANALFARALDRASSLGLSLEIARSKAAWGEMALLHAQAPNNGYTLVAEAREALKAHEAGAELEVLMVTGQGRGRP